MKIKTQFSEALTIAVAAALAATVAVWIARIPSFPQPYWAAISALIVIQADLRSTLRASRDRLIGTFIGALIGSVFVMYLGWRLWSFGLAVIATVLVCMLLRLQSSYRLATVTVAIVMLVNAGGWRIALDRFAEVSIGILVAIGVRALLNTVRRVSGAIPLPHLDREHEEMQE